MNTPTLLPAVQNQEMFVNVDAPVCTEDECNRILARLDPDAWVPAAVTSEDGYGQVDLDRRSVLRQAVPLASDDYLCRKIAAAVGHANERFWRFDLTGFPSYDAPSVLLYDAEVQDHFGVHVDAGPSHSTRKLSFSVQLSPRSEYRGGDLFFPDDHSTGSREQGSMTVFSALTRHEVLPLISGRRLALVGWFHGPAFR